MNIRRTLQSLQGMQATQEELNLSRTRQRRTNCLQECTILDFSHLSSLALRGSF